MEINDGYLNQRNYSVVTEFLSSMRNANYKESSINERRRRLRFFFKDRKEEFTTIKQDDIQKWVEKLRGYQKVESIQPYVSVLRGFYKFCIMMNYVKESPVMENRGKGVNRPYWILKENLPNEMNQITINEFLKNMKDSGRNEIVVRAYRNMLQRFFITCKKPYPSISKEDLDQWVDKYRNKWATNTIRQFYNFIRSFYTFCEERGYIENVPIKKSRWVTVANNYWEIQQPIANPENRVVLNEFLLYLNDEGYTKVSIETMRYKLQHFFRRRKEIFTSITMEEVNLWIEKNFKSNGKDTISNYISSIRSFYRFCFLKGYIEDSPIINKSKWERRESKSWVIAMKLANARNQEVINEFLLSMKVSNYSEGTIKTKRNFLVSFFREREETFDSLTSNCILAWLIQHQKGRKERTVCNNLSMLNSFFRFCIEEEYMVKSPIKMRWLPRVPKPIPKFLEKGEVAKIRLLCEDVQIRNRAIVEFFLATGCRVAEVHGLDKEHIDFENRTATVTGKGKKIRTVHFTENCSMILKKYLATRTDKLSAFFVSKWGERIKISYIQRIVKELGESAKLPSPLHPHRFRHTFATELLAKGASLSFIADELGHEDIKVTKVYANLPRQEILAMYRKYMG